MVLYASNNGIKRAFQNLISGLNLIQFSTGGHLSLFFVWNQIALKSMYSIYIDKAVKKTLPAYTITNSDLAFLINFENI